jgi:hypothetical protein
MKKHSNKMAALAMLISASIAAPAAIAQTGSGAASPCAPKRQRSANPCGPAANPCAPKRRSKRAEEVQAEKEAAEKAAAEKAEAEKKEAGKK